MTLALFYADIKAALRRGSSADASIPGYTKRALLWLEQNYTFAYMSTVTSVALTVGPNSHIVALTPRPKVLKFVRALSRDATLTLYRYLEKVAQEQVLSIDAGDPNYYWLEGNIILKLDGRVQEPLTLELGGKFYTNLPTDTALTTPMLVYYENLLRAQTLMEAAVDLKDERMYMGYKGARDEALTAVLVAEEENLREDTELEMRYVG